MRCRTYGTEEVLFFAFYQYQVPMGPIGRYNANEASSLIYVTK